MCKSVFSGGIAALLLAVSASAQTARLDVQVSNDNLNWVDSMFAPAGSTVYVRVVASTTAPNSVGFANATYQPTLSNWTAADLRLPFTSTSAAINSNTGVPAALGRMSPFGSVSMGNGSTSGQLSSFVDGGSTLRLAGSRATTMLSSLTYGIVSSQIPKSSGGASYNNSSSSAVVLKYAVQLGNSPALRTMVADVPLAGIPNARTQWYTSLVTGTGNPTSINLTASDIDPATIYVGPPNVAPTAVGDLFSMLEDQTLFVTNASILDNDTDPDANETKTAELVATTPNGTLTLNANGTFSYIPALDYNGTDSFTYVVRDQYNAASNVGTVTISIADVNDTPIFTAASPTPISEDSGQRTLNGWASFNPGNGESGQSVSEYDVMSVGNPALFSVLPSINTDGTLTFTPAPNMNGGSSFEVRVRDTGGTANGGNDSSSPAVFNISVLPVNDSPVFVASPLGAVAEDAGQQSISGWSSFNAGPNESDQTLLGYSVSNISNAALFSVQPTIAPDGTLVYTPAPNAFGSSAFTVTARDSGGVANGGTDTSSPQTFTVTVNPVNDAPTFVAASPAGVNEDVSQQTINNWATFNVGGGSAEAGQTVQQYIVSNISNPALFSGLPSVSNSGVLTYTPAPNANGNSTFQVQVRDNGGTASGGVDTSVPQSFSITINPINDAPTFIAIAPSAVNEDSGAVTLANWATFSAGPGEASQSVFSYTVSSLSNAPLFAVAPAVSADGTLTFISASNANGTSTFQVRVRDNGGTASGGVDTSTLQTFTVNINAVNDAPTVSLAAIPTIVEDGGSQTISGFASFNVGAPNESGQGLSQYIVSNVGNPAMFAAGPSVSNSGVLTYTPSSNASGTVTFSVQARDNGGTANGGVDLSVAVAATINITNVNDAPTFVAANAVSNEDAGTVNLTGWAAFNAGPFEDAQGVASYTVSNITNPSLFTVAPTVSTDGTLGYSTAPNASGTATFQVRVRDNGGTASGGADTSVPQTFSITVNPVNDAPTLALNSIPVIEEDSGPQNVGGFASFNPGASNESAQSVVEYIVSNVSNPASFIAGPLVSPSGVLMYAPAPDASGIITFNVQVRDNGGTADGGLDLSQTTVASLTINGVNDPPIARARNVTIDARNGCVPLQVPPSAVNDGSYDPDNTLGELRIAINRTGEFPIGVTPVQLSVTDPSGLTSTATATVTVMANDSNNNSVPDSCDLLAGGGGPDCDGDGDSDESQCLWDNGTASGLNGITNGQVSQYGGNPSARVADDFYLSPGLVYRMTSFRGQIVTNSIERGARLSLFEDCDGSPYLEPFYTFDTEEVASEVPTIESGYSLITYVFNLCDEKLVLDGGKTYWVSIQAKVDCNVTDRAYWASVSVGSNPMEMLASVPVKAGGLGDYPCLPEGYEPWASIADCCIGCVNMAYLFTGEPCQLLWDNGPIDLGVQTRGGDASGINRAVFSRAADNIAIKPCREERICFIQAWIWTNCNPVQGFIEFYDNQCALPSGRYVHRAEPTDIILLEGEFITVDGVRYQGYRLEFWDVPFTLQGNRNYWVSVGADGTGSFNARSFFAFSDQTDPCLSCERRHLTYGAVLPNPVVSSVWTRTNREYAFRIATVPFYLDTVSVSPDSVVNNCPPDFNRDRQITVQDLFDYITAYFAGCP